MIRVHGTCVEIDGAAVLLRGPPGAGKSDLALRLIDGGARLVADDQTELRRGPSGLVASAPPTIAGRLEVRGIGILDCPWIPAAPLRLVADLVPADRIERLPEPRRCRLLDCELPLIAIHAFEASAAAKLRLAVRHHAASPAQARAS